MRKHLSPTDLGKPAWIYDAKVWTYGEILREVELCRETLKGQKGLCVLHGFSPLELWIHLIAAWEEGLCMLPLSHRSPLNTYATHLAQLPAATLIHKEGDPELIVGHEHDAGPSDEVQLLIFTSGSTGAPKAIGHSLDGLFASALATLAFYSFKPGDRWLLGLDLSHIGGLQIALRCWLGKGICIAEGEPKNLAPALQTYQVDFLSLVPTQLHRLLDDEQSIRALQKAKAILIGGAAAAEGLWRRAEARALPLSITYGSTETASQISAFAPGIFPNAPHCVGVLLDHWSIRVSDDDLLRPEGAALFKGYWQGGRWHPQENFCLPDRGHFDGRFLYIEGRYDDIFQVAGENLNPQEILRPLTERGLVSDAFVLPKDDPEFGNLPLLIVRSPELPNLEAMLQVFSRDLIPVKRPREIWWHESQEVSKPSRHLYESWLKNHNQTLKLLWAYERI